MRKDSRNELPHPRLSFCIRPPSPAVPGKSVLDIRFHMTAFTSTTPTLADCAGGRGGNFRERDFGGRTPGFRSRCEKVIAATSQIGTVRAYCLLVGGGPSMGRFIFLSRAWKRGSERRLSYDRAVQTMIRQAGIVHLQAFLQPLERLRLLPGFHVQARNIRRKDD